MKKENLKNDFVEIIEMMQEGVGMCMEAVSKIIDAEDKLIDAVKNKEAEVPEQFYKVKDIVWLKDKFDSLEKVIPAIGKEIKMLSTIHGYPIKKGHSCNEYTIDAINKFAAKLSQDKEYLAKYRK